VMVGKVTYSLVFIGVTDTKIADAISDITSWFNGGRVAFNTSGVDCIRGTSVPFNLVHAPSGNF